MSAAFNFGKASYSRAALKGGACSLRVGQKQILLWQYIVQTIRLPSRTAPSNARPTRRWRQRPRGAF